MKKIPEIFRTKQPGISMIIGLAISFIVLGITLSILFLSEKYREQSQNINLSNQTFFTLESGQEAAIFHHNARGQGLHFPGNIDDVPDSQIAEISPTNTAKWIVRGRTDNLGNDDFLTGILKENQAVQIPFFWDDSSDIESTPDIENITNNTFRLTFGRRAFDENGNPTGDILIENDFDFGAENEEVLINWSLSKTDDSDVTTTFIPRSNLGLFLKCGTVGTTTGFFCEGNIGETISSDIDIPGYIIPGGILNPTTLQDFYADDDIDRAKFMLLFQPVLPFTDSNGTDKIQGIPWKLELIEGFPKHYYEIEVQANIGNFQKTLRRNIFEKTSSQGLDTVILD